MAQFRRQEVVAQNRPIVGQDRQDEAQGRQGLVQERHHAVGQARDVALAFRNDQQLQQFVLNGVTQTDRVLGNGSYGSVEEVVYKKVVCAGKKLHEVLIEAGNDGVDGVVHKYLQECQLMSSLRHPNITQFLGLCFLPGTQLPVLVMERLETSLDDLLEHIPNLPLSLKRSILEDVASGLLYLHNRPSPVIHRDLTARNVLLTSNLVAKITDMGNSRIVDLRGGQMARTLSKLPGTLVYMPPEALDDRHRYGPSLDIFSFGHLALFVLSQTFPCNLLPSTFPNPDNLEAVRGRTEVERRDVYMQLIETRIGCLHPSFVQLVKQCLHNVPDQRPSTDELLATLQRMKVEVEGEYGVSLVKLDMGRVKLCRELRRKDRRIAELTQQQERREAEREEMAGQIERLREDLEVRDRRILELQTEVQTNSREIVTTSCHLQRNRHEMETKNDMIQQQQNTIEDLETQLEETRTDFHRRLRSREAQMREELQSKDAEIRELGEELRRCHRQSLQRTGQTPQAPPLDLSWRSGPEMPMEMRGHVQSVMVEGTVYIGGGHVGRGYNDKNTIFEYDIASEKWSKLQLYRASHFALTTIHNQLVLVGGEERDHKTKVVGAWSVSDREWTHPYPEMRTARSECSAVVYKDWLVVSGGISADFGVALSSIEVLHTGTKQWYTGPSAPTAWAYMKAAAVGDVCYFMGGCTGKIGALSGIFSEKIYSVSLPALIGQLNSRNSKERDKQIKKEMWREISGLQLKSTPLSIGGTLLAIGGRNKDREATTAIHLYIPDTGVWVKVGDLPTPRYDCTCVQIGEREILVAAGFHHGMVKGVDMAVFNT